jgi:hypothetical protein
MFNWIGLFNFVKRLRLFIDETHKSVENQGVNLGLTYMLYGRKTNIQRPFNTVIKLLVCTYNVLIFPKIVLNLLKVPSESIRFHSANFI